MPGILQVLKPVAGFEIAGTTHSSTFWTPETGESACNRVNAIVATKPSVTLFHWP